MGLMGFVGCFQCSVVSASAVQRDEEFGSSGLFGPLGLRELGS